MLQFYWNDTRAKVKKKNLQELAVGPKWSNIKPSKTTFHSTKRFQSRPLLFFSLWIELWNIYQAMGSRKNRLLLPPKKSMEHLENRLNNRIDDVLMEPVKKTDVERQVHPSGWKKKTGKHLGNLQKLAQRPFQRAAIDILLEPFVDLLTQQTQSTSGKEALKKKNKLRPS